MAPARRWIVAAVIGAISCLPSFPSLRHADWTASGRGWARGPVWYIMTHDEYRDYRRLHSDPKRREFIQEFWRQRDPLPDTENNELEREFWRRVGVADDHFGQDIKPGWKTERGKVFIMLGPPDNFDHDHILSDTYGSRRWIYDFGSMPLQLRLVLQESLGVPTQRRFVRLKVRGENVGSRAVSHGMPLQSSILRPTDSLPLAETLVRRVPGPDALRNLGALMRVPEVLERERSRVDVTTVFSLVPLQARIDFRRRPPAASSDGTIVAVTLGVTQADLRRAGVSDQRPEAAILSGHLTSIDDEKRSYPLHGGFAADPAPEPAPESLPARVFQVVSQVPPGRYLLDIAYQDTDQRIMGSVRDLIDVPAFEAAGLSVSSLVLSSRLERVEGQPGGDATAPFTLGEYRVIPRTTQVYGRGEALTVFYEVSGARSDGEGRPHLDLSYQFYLEDGGSWLPVGAPFAAPDRGDPQQAWSVPLAGLPPGRYRLEVTVTDRIAELTAIRGALFEVVASPD